MPSLSILIATVPERRKEFEALQLELLKQRVPFGEDVEIVVDGRPRPNFPGGVTIGQKRNDLKARATKTHLVFHDDDDIPKPWYIADIMKALATDPDCVGCLIKHVSNGRRAPDCVHSLRFKTWSAGPVSTPRFGRVYQRNVTHRNPVRTSIAMQVDFPAIGYGEDEPWSNAITALCKTEVFMARPSFTYNYSSKEPHEEKYFGKP